jgi:hypothetical protein
MAKGIAPPHLNAPPTEGFGLQVDGKIKSQYATSEEALKAGLEIKKKFPMVQVVLFDAVNKTRIPVELSQETPET